MARDNGASMTFVQSERKRQDGQPYGLNACQRNARPEFGRVGRNIRETGDGFVGHGDVE